jgi:hypothetical protein
MYSISVSSKHHKKTKYQFTAFQNKDISSFKERSVVDEGALKQVHLGVLQLSPANHHSTSTPYSTITTPQVCNNPDQAANIIPSFVS